ncbi:CvpA family protein [Sporolactobacillus sp. THM7-4]|nr:CvpA family protein [Sporolactobacillus sp. THM7-4]
MLLNLIILLLLAAGFFNGFRRGLVLQLVHLAGFIAAYIVAFMYYKHFASVLKLWIPYPSTVTRSQTFTFLGNIDLQSAYYQAIAFIILFIAVKIVMNIMGSMLDFLAQLPLIRSLNHLSGAFLGFVEIYLILFLLLYAGALTPLTGIQTSIEHSSLAQSMIDHTPVFSKMFKDMWVAFMFLN